MFFNQGPKGTFIQILQADRSAIYRLLIEHRGVDLDIKRFTACAGTSHLDAVFCLPEGDTPSPMHDESSSVLSVTLGGEEPHLAIFYDGKSVARLTPHRHSLLKNRQNLLMVNPGIDGGFHEYTNRHDIILRSEAAGRRTYSLQPLISIIVPLFHTPSNYARAMLDSVVAQQYETWELVLVNASPNDADLSNVLSEYPDKRIRTIIQNENLGIAGNTNVGIRACRGDYVAFLDHDDMLDPLALHIYVQALNENPEIDLFYCDEDNFHETLSDRYGPIFKPDFNIDLLYSHNYVEHFLMVSRWALERIELSPHDVRGAQDYDLTLKVAEIARGIHHAPYLLYHWRAHSGSTNGGNMSNKPYAIKASIYALNRHFTRMGISATAQATDIPCVFSIAYKPHGSKMYVALKYRTHEGLRSCLDCLTKQTCNSSLVILPIGPEPKIARALIKELNIEAYRETTSSNETDAPSLEAIYSAATRDDAPLLLCSDAVRLYDTRCIERLSGCLTRTDVAIVAPKLYYADSVIQHVGYHLDAHGGARAVLINQGFGPHMGGGYLGTAECCCDVGSVGPNCLLVAPSRLPIAHQSSDAWTTDEAYVHHLCCAARSLGLHIVVLPEATATVYAPVIWDWHDERAQTMSTSDRKRLQQLWPKQISHDPLDNPHIHFEHGYANLAISRNIDREARRIFWRDKIGKFL